MSYRILFFVSSVTGIFLGLVLGDVEGLQDALSLFAQTIITLGRYLLFLFVLVGGAYAVSKLLYQQMLGKILLRGFAIIGSMWVAAIALGLLIGGVIVPGRIPPALQEADPLQIDNFFTHIERIFPSNIFRTLTQEGQWMLPVAIFALIIGFLAVSELRRGTNTIMDLLQAISDSVWHLLKTITMGMSILVGGLASYTIASIRVIDDILIFLPLLVVLSITTVLLVFFVFPLILSLFTKRNMLLQWYQAIRIPVFAGIWSGDAFFPFPFTQKSAVEEQSISSSVSMVVVTITTLFGRVGTMLVAATGFMVVIRSYSALEITVPQILSIVGAMVMYSFALHALPSTGVSVLLALLSAWYIKGAGETYLILFPVFFILHRLAVAIDVAAGLFVVFLTKITEPVEAEFSRTQLRQQLLMEDHQ